MSIQLEVGEEKGTYGVDAGDPFHREVIVRIGFTPPRELVQSVEDGIGVRGVREAQSPDGIQQAASLGGRNGVAGVYGVDTQGRRTLHVGYVGSGTPAEQYQSEVGQLYKTL
jgi:hypothetical protein